jgi:hypothetical protein
LQFGQPVCQQIAHDFLKHVSLTSAITMEETENLETVEIRSNLVAIWRKYG